jgi:hypothetical protein
MYMGASSGTAGQFIYQRALAGGIWSPWRGLWTARVDQTAGRAIYMRDDLNSRDQLIFGNTGLRDVTTLIDTSTYTFPGGVPSGYAAYLRRNGNMVHFSLRSTVILANSSGTPMITLPVGYRADATVTAVALLEAGPTPTPTAIQANPTGTVRAWHSGNTGVMTANLFWTTNEPWPTTLPGSAVGTIPNA